MIMCYFEGDVTFDGAPAEYAKIFIHTEDGHLKTSLTTQTGHFRFQDNTGYFIAQGVKYMLHCEFWSINWQTYELVRIGRPLIHGPMVPAIE